MPVDESPPVDPATKPPASEPVPPTRRECAAWYLGAILLTSVVLFAALRLDSVSLKSPLTYDGDALLIMPLVKATLERGSHWRIERMGYPGILEMHDFPVIDHLHFAIIWVLGLFLADWVVVYNAYYLLTYPLTTFTAMYAFRRLGLSLPMAAVGGLLYAFQPYHYTRGEAHYFLAAYWMIPISLLPALAICRGELPFFRKRESDGTYRLALWQRATLWQVLLGAATASAGAYYAFFACAIYAFVGIYQWFVLRTWKAAASAAILCGLVCAFGIVNHLPAIAYTLKNGRNTVTERLPGEAETYGLKIAHLVLPLDAHNFTVFGRLKARYNSFERPLQNENTCATMGLTASVGLIGLLIVLVLPCRRVWPYGPLAAVAGFILLYGTIGGFSSIFNLLVFDQIRCPNRISIYLAFICLFAALNPLDRFLLTRTGRGRQFRYPALAALAFFGVADQTPTPWFTERVLDSTYYEARRFQADREFFRRVEESMPEGAKIFNCPYISFPEVQPVADMNTYEPVRGYLHTRTLVWSYASMKNREVDVWQEDVSHDSHEGILRRIVAAGFDGILIDKRGFQGSKEFPNMGEHMVALFKLHGEGTGRGYKLPLVENEGRTLAFFDLRPYRDWLRAQDPIRFEQWSREEREFVALTWISGFVSSEGYGQRNLFRWGIEKGAIAIVNPSDRVRKFHFSAKFGTDTEGDFRVHIDGSGIVQVNRPDGPGPWSDDFTIETEFINGNPPKRILKTLKDYVLEIPPGRHFVKFRCTPPFNFIPGDSRARCYFLQDIKFFEVK